MLTKKNKKIARKAILKYVQEKIDESFINNETNNNTSLEGYCIPVDQAYDAIGNIVHADSSTLNDNEKAEYFKALKDDECFQFNGYNLKITKVPLEFKLSQKFKITIDTISENAAGYAVIGAVILAIPIGVVAMQTNAEKQKTILTCNNQNYNMKDIYVVHNEDNMYLCNRKNNSKKDVSVDPIYYVNSDGKMDLYRYMYDVDEGYDYFNIENGKLVCSSDDDNYQIDELIEYYTIEQIEDHNYKFDIKEVQKYINNDYLISKDSYLKLK